MRVKKTNIQTLERPKGLTHKQWVFAQEFIIDYNGKQAAIRSGYALKSAEVSASRLISSAKVQLAIAQAQHFKAKVAEITVERVLEEMRRLAFAQTTDMVTLKGGWVHIADTDSLSVEQKAAISQIKQAKDGSVEVKFYDKQKALDSLAKAIGMFNEPVNQDPQGQLAPVLQVVFGNVNVNQTQERVIEITEGGS